METKERMDLETQLLEGVLKKIRKKGLMVINEEKYRLEFIMGLQIAVQHCIEHSSYIKEVKPNK